MNPILDIFAAAQTNASPIPVGAGLIGQPAEDGQFAQLFADAVAATPQQTQVPVAGILAKGTGDPEVAKLAQELTANPIIAQAEEIVSEVVDQVSTTERTSTPTGDVTPLLAQVQTTPAVAGNGTPTIISVVNVDPVPSMEVLVRLTAIEMPQDQETSLLNCVESELSAHSGKQANGILVNATIEVSDEAAKALEDVETEFVAKKMSESNNETSLNDQKATGKTIAVKSHSLKSQLQKAYPSLNIESATGKAIVQVNLTNADKEAQTKVDLPISTKKLAVTNGLPIAVAPQIVAAPKTAAAVRTTGPATKPTRVVRQVQATGKTPIQNPARTVVDNEAPARLENRIEIRKPVQMALKSQGFDIEKLMGSAGSAKDSLAENVAIDKADVRIAVEKHLQQATDRSLEINGTERFKLDIKRGHIEALLKKGEIKLQLQPEHLGHLKIKLTTTPTEVSARMETSSEDAKRAVELSLPQLRESFERAGLRLNSIEVLVNDDNDSRRQHAFQQGWRGRSGRSNASEDRLIVNVPAAAEISQNSSTVYGGALNLVA